MEWKAEIPEEQGFYYAKIKANPKRVFIVEVYKLTYEGGPRNVILVPGQREPIYGCKSSFTPSGSNPKDAWVDPFLFIGDKIETESLE